MKKTIIFFTILIFQSLSFANEIKLEDLKFDQSDLKVDAKKQEILEKRVSMLDTHQTLGYVTAGLLTASMITGKEGEVTDAHKYLGIAAGLSYYATAYYAIKAPEIEGTEHKGASLWHKRLAWVHGPAMLMVPVLGLLAERQLDKGEKIHGIAKLHKPVAAVAFYSFLSSLAVITFDF